MRSLPRHPLVLAVGLRLSNPDAVLSRSDLTDLGYERRAVGRDLPCGAGRGVARLLAADDNVLTDEAEIDYLETLSRT
jgi:hypothetical protein